ncbi:MAG: histidine phosphatase family protein [Deltaproteobacteria bacterium]|nr:histidine phosphatase family protein [Deltaproteobacteria bacterium]MBW2418034.1 histidine phosphatase family protein [Deltaproteobacteria bacterium]
MKVHLVRHARAIPRADWRRSGEDDLRATSGGVLEPAADELARAASRDAADRQSEPSHFFDSEEYQELRPLNDTGRAQADALAEHLLGDPPERLLASPALRCQQTLEPLALALGLPVEVDDRLGDGEALPGLSELVSELGATPAALCTHSALIAGFLELLELSDETEEAGPLCRKGAVWTLEGSGSLAPQRASYFEPSPSEKGRSKSSPLRREVARPRSVRAAVLDMGSTSFTLLIADVNRNGVIQPVVREKVMLRLGAVIASQGKIPSEVGNRAVEVARELHRIAIPEKVEHFLPVATAALREARNGRKLAEKIAKAVDQPVRILEGEAEARLMFGAFQQRLALGRQPVLGLDLGGGSLELAVGSGRGIESACTLPLGAVRLQHELVSSDPMRPRDARRIRTRVEEALAPQRSELLRRLPERMVVAGGTPRAIARLVAAEGGADSASKALPSEIHLAELSRMATRLVATSHQDRLAMPGIRRRRSDLLATGALVLVTVAEVLGLEHFTFCDWGLREGVLLDLIAKTPPHGVA